MVVQFWFQFFNEKCEIEVRALQSKNEIHNTPVWVFSFTLFDINGQLTERENLIKNLEAVFFVSANGSRFAPLPFFCQIFFLIIVKVCNYKSKLVSSAFLCEHFALSSGVWYQKIFRNKNSKSPPFPHHAPLTVKYYFLLKLLIV